MAVGQQAIAESTLKHTLLLDTVAWDLVLDVYGNIALATDPYSLAQDAASAIRLFQGELYYDTLPGVPYWQSILGRRPPLSLIKQAFVEAALRVPGVKEAQCFITEITDRAIHGQVQVTSTTGTLSAAGF